jgi:hypothetical protein
MTKIPNSVIAAIGIDIGKNSFHVVALDRPLPMLNAIWLPKPFKGAILASKPRASGECRSISRTRRYGWTP